MTSEPTTVESTKSGEKRRSCDVCRRRKVRCDGDPMVRGKCTNCTNNDAECTYLNAGKQRKPSVGIRVLQLEMRERCLVEILQGFLPGVDLTGELDIEELAGIASLPETLAFQVCRRSTSDMRDIRGHDDHLISRDVWSADDLSGRFFGQSSSAIFVRSLFEWKAYETANQNPGAGVDAAPPHTKVKRRKEYWEVKSWEAKSLVTKTVPGIFSFPEHDLMDSLIDLYFEHVNPFMPLLHRPTFTRTIAAGVHFTDSAFGSVLLLVCAIGSRFSHDPRVLSEGTASTLSSGWKWFVQVQVYHHQASFMAPASLYVVQTCILVAEFLRGASSCDAAWTVIGVGIRLAQDVGAHRWQTFGVTQSTEREQWVRAWWSLVVQDRIASAALGQICITEGWDFDVGLPADCDDEYWDHPDPDKAWKQPDGVPSKAAFFLAHIKLTQILSSAMMFLYASPKVKKVHNFQMFANFDQHVVTHLDSALNLWVDNMPDHLRNPQSQKKNSIFRRQSIVLHAELYLLQIYLHRPFLTGPDKEHATMTAVSITICTNAARACSRLLDTEDPHCLDVSHRIQWPILSAAVVLLLSVWSGKRMGLEGSYAKEMKNVERCMKMSQYCEQRWQPSGQVVDLLHSLMQASDLDQPPRSSRVSPHKESALHAKPALSESVSGLSAQPEPLYSNMPLYAEDLARIPIYNQSGMNPGVDAGASSSLHPDPLLSEAYPASDPYYPGATNDTNIGLADPYSGATFYHHQHPEQPNPATYSGPPMEGPGAGYDAGVYNLFDSETLAMWTSVPVGQGFNSGAWGTYVDNVNEAQISGNMGQMRMG